MIEKTLVLLKPDAVQRSLAGKILERFENVGLKVIGMKMIWMDKDLVKKHYPESLIPILGEKTLEDWKRMNVKTNKSKEEIGKEVREDLVKYVTEGPVIALVLEGVHAVDIVRKLVGSTSPHAASPGTIRGDFCSLSMGYATQRKFGGRNLIHASGSVTEAKNEIELWFKTNELHSYKTVHEQHTR